MWPNYAPLEHLGVTDYRLAALCVMAEPRSRECPMQKNRKGACGLHTQWDSLATKNNEFGLAGWLSKWRHSLLSLSLFPGTHVEEEENRLLNVVLWPFTQNKWVSKGDKQNKEWSHVICKKDGTWNNYMRRMKIISEKRTSCFMVTRFHTDT